MVLSFRAEMEHPGNSFVPIFCFITYESNQGSCMLIVARGNPRLLALTDSPVKLVASHGHQGVVGVGKGILPC